MSDLQELVCELVTGPLLLVVPPWTPPVVDTRVSEPVGRNWGRVRSGEWGRLRVHLRLLRGEPLPPVRVVQHVHVREVVVGRHQPVLRYNVLVAPVCRRSVADHVHVTLAPMHRWTDRRVGGWTDPGGSPRVR